MVSVVLFFSRKCSLFYFLSLRYILVFSKLWNFVYNRWFITIMRIIIIIINNEKIWNNRVLFFRSIISHRCFCQHVVKLSIFFLYLIFSIFLYPYSFSSLRVFYVWLHELIFQFLLGEYIITIMHYEIYLFKRWHYLEICVGNNLFCIWGRFKKSTLKCLGLSKAYLFQCTPLITL